MIQYTIHEVAALLNISTDAIRLYEKEGLVQRPRAIRKTATATMTPNRSTASWESVSTASST